jgi:hypothetical protein
MYNSRDGPYGIVSSSKHFLSYAVIAVCPLPRSRGEKPALTECRVLGNWNRLYVEAGSDVVLVTNVTDGVGMAEEAKEHDPL